MTTETTTTPPDTTTTTSPDTTTTTPDTTTTPTAPRIGPDGKLSEGWFLELGDEFAAHAADLGKHKDIRSLIEERNYYRKGGVEYPGEGADAKAVERWQKAAHVPDSPEGYGITPEAFPVPEGMEFDKTLADSIAQAAHAAHAPPAAVAAVAKAYHAHMESMAAAARDAQTKAIQAAQDELVAEWRGDFEKNAATVRHYTARLAETAGVSPEAAAAMANSPAFARIMLQVAKMTAEDGTRTPTGFGDIRSPDQKIADIKAGRDPHWSKLYQSASEADKFKAYEHIKSLREQAAQ